MIVDLNRFVETGRPRWERLEKTLDRMEADPTYRPTLGDAEQLSTLYQQTCTDLARVASIAAEPELKRYLEWLVSRAYCEIHETRGHRGFSFRKWFLVTFPVTFRRHIRAFQLSVALTILGALFGAVALKIDPEAKAVLMPFAHLQGSPKERVAREMARKGDELQGRKGRFSAMLMTHNTQVAFFTLALGLTFAVGTVLILFYNGVILGAVAFDYVAAGQTPFLLGWLLPHGVIEIPAILIAGQAGFLLGRALIGQGDRRTRAQRFRDAAPDLVTLAAGAALMLVWAGIVESFFSQYHEPVIPYAVKIGFGLTELALLTAFLGLRGRTETE